MPVELLKFPPAYVVVGLSRLVTDSKIWKPILQVAGYQARRTLDTYVLCVGDKDPKQSQKALF